MAQNGSKEPGRLYFAYGSNLSTTQMRHRCPRSTPISLAYVSNWTWIINERGYANIVAIGCAPADKTGLEAETSDGGHVTGSSVYGLVYRLHPDDEAKLDRYEGVGFAYERWMILATEAKYPTGDAETRPHEGNASPMLDGNVELLTYIDTNHVTPSAPKEEYIDRMNVGIKEASEWGLPASYVDDVIRRYIPAPVDEDEKDNEEE
ncbi:hypothetical protein F5Y12DRAFT_714831 [Xylaria sp. FL1777]|nr:hypothetical protein F5Y12DRAFT_714831 [Xylaria sp. FL1777]